MKISSSLLKSSILHWIFLFISVAVLKGAEQDEVKLLRWAGPPGSRPDTYREWLITYPYSGFYYKHIKTVSGGYKSGTVAIIIEQDIASSITDELDLLIGNLQQEGYTILRYEVSGGMPEDLKLFLQNLYSTDNIEGALFIGDLPVAWFQIKNDFYEYGYAEWPIDLFYMDLDGNWLDTLKWDPIDTLVPGQDSIYDAHSGNLSPEIYIGRLTPTGIGNDTLLIKNYLLKDDAYRYSIIELQHRAMIYVDDDWADPYFVGDVALIYPDTLLVLHPETTRANDYRTRLDTVRAWVSLFAHSWPGGHAFAYNNYTSWDYYYSYEYTDQNPPANFYNHFCCSFARYTTNGYGGGRAIFNESYGVGAIGSTKTGSMLDFYYFYLPLSQGKNLGEAFKDWFTHITQYGVSFSELCWHYGMTLLGDPFLFPVGHAIYAPCSLMVRNSGGNPGSTSNPVVINFDNSTAVGYLEFRLDFDGSFLSIDSVILDSSLSYMDFLYDVGTDSIRIILSSTGGDSILPGQWNILRLLFSISETAPSGDSTLLKLKNCKVFNPYAERLYCKTSNGWFYFLYDLVPPELFNPLNFSFTNDNTPLFDWSNVDGALKYHISVATDTTFVAPVIEDSMLICSFLIPVASLSDTVFYWRARTADCSEWSDWSSIWSFTVDTKSPVFDSTTVLTDTFDFWGPFGVSTRVLDNHPFYRPIIFYRTSADTSWVSDSMNALGNSWYMDSISEQPHQNGLEIDYYLAVRDFAGNFSRDPASGFYSFRIDSLQGTEEVQNNSTTYLFISPNPAIADVNINYGLREKAEVGLKVYDVSGRLIKNINSGMIEAGSHKLIIKKGELKEGVYFLVLGCPEPVLIKKMIIIH